MSNKYRYLERQLDAVYFPTLLEVSLSVIDGRLMKQALNELDPFVWARPCWDRGPYGT